MTKKNLMYIVGIADENDDWVFQGVGVGENRSKVIDKLKAYALEKNLAKESKTLIFEAEAPFTEDGVPTDHEEGIFDDTNLGKYLK